MGVARFTEVPATLEDIGGGLASKMENILGFFGGLFSKTLSPRAEDRPPFGERLNDAVNAATEPTAAPSFLFVLAIVVWAMRFAFITKGAMSMMRNSAYGMDLLESDAPAGGGKSKTA